jgi:prepilin-type N-terminal cleavage/methylation domain-containing protein
MSRRRDAGFTLLEVVVAVFVFATVMSGLIVLVSQNVRRMADARDDLRTTRLAEQKLREVLFSAEEGNMPEPGTTQGTFEGDDSDVAFEIEVAPYAVPIPRAAPEKAASGSRMFGAGGNVSAQPVLRRVVLKVFPAGQTSEQARPFVGFVAEKNEPVAGSEGTGEEGQDEGESSDSQDGTGSGAPGGDAQNQEGVEVVE